MNVSYEIQSKKKNKLQNKAEHKYTIYKDRDSLNNKINDKNLKAKCKQL